MKHFILTRNRYPAGHPGLGDRIKLFRQLTIPSLRAQTNRNFTWLINGREGLSDDDFSGVDVRVAEDFRGHILKYIQEDRECSQLITTRLDNDDALLPGFVEAVQQHAVGQRDLLIDASGFRADLRNGMLYGDALYRVNFPSPFLTVVEGAQEIGKLKLAFFDFHRLMHRHFPVHRLSERLWVQTIHQNNQLMNTDTDLLRLRSTPLGKLYDIAHQLGLGLYADGASSLREP